MKYKEVFKKLEDDGWYVERTGKHIIMKHPVKSGSIPVPFHGSRDIPQGTLKSILKKAGLE